MLHYSLIEKSHSDRLDEIGNTLRETYKEMCTMGEIGTRDWKRLNL